MFEAILVCSDEGCGERFAATGALEELEALACDCGCALLVVAISEDGQAEEGGVVLEPLA